VDCCSLTLVVLNGVAVHIVEIQMMRVRADLKYPSLQQDWHAESERLSFSDTLDKIVDMFLGQATDERAKTRDSEHGISRKKNRTVTPPDLLLAYSLPRWDPVPAGQTR
jgi:hypothetical protein